jgi:transcriptional regulator with XRE-family HTH domain
MDTATEKLPLETRNYMLGIVSFLDKIDHYQSLLEGLPTYSPLVETLDELRDALDEAIEWLNEYMETDEDDDDDEDEDEDESMETEMDYAALVENLRDDAASTLEEALGALSAISLNIPEEWKDAADDEDEDDESDDEKDVRVVIQALDDTEELSDNIVSDLREHGYHLYHVFIGALFPCNVA